VRDRGSALGVASESTRSFGLAGSAGDRTSAGGSLHRFEFSLGFGVGESGASHWRANALVAGAFTATVELFTKWRPGVVFRADSVFEMEARPWLSFLRNLLPAPF
jgi:hypothetical protein